MSKVFIAGFMVGAVALNAVHFVVWAMLPNYPYLWKTKALDKYTTLERVKDG